MVVIDDELNANGNNMKGSGHNLFYSIITVFDCYGLGNMGGLIAQILIYRTFWLKTEDIFV
jgi:hypothetical protein